MCPAWVEAPLGPDMDATACTAETPAPRTAVLPPEWSATAPVVQVKNFISAGRATTARMIMVRPTRTVRGSVPSPTMANAVAYTSAAIGL